MSINVVIEKNKEKNILFEKFLSWFLKGIWTINMGQIRVFFF